MRLLLLLLLLLSLQKLPKKIKMECANGFGPGLISGAARLQHTAAPW
jgi:hypothetical protein